MLEEGLPRPPRRVEYPLHIHVAPAVQIVVRQETPRQVRRPRGLRPPVGPQPHPAAVLRTRLRRHEMRRGLPLHQRLQAQGAVRPLTAAAPDVVVTGDLDVVLPAATAVRALVGAGGGSAAAPAPAAPALRPQLPLELDFPPADIFELEQLAGAGSSRTLLEKFSIFDDRLFTRGRSRRSERAKELPSIKKERIRKNSAWNCSLR